MSCASDAICASVTTRCVAQHNVLLGPHRPSSSARTHFRICFTFAESASNVLFVFAPPATCGPLVSFMLDWAVGADGRDSPALMCRDRGWTSAVVASARLATVSSARQTSPRMSKSVRNAFCNLPMWWNGHAAHSRPQSPRARTCELCKLWARATIPWRPARTAMIEPRCAPCRSGSTPRYLAMGDGVRRHAKVRWPCGTERLAEASGLLLPYGPSAPSLESTLLASAAHMRWSARCASPLAG